MVREKHVLLGNPGAGKTTLINCLIGEAKLNTDGRTDKYQNVQHGDILYMDTPGLANEQIVKEAAETITMALQQGGDYKLFFLVRLQSGRVVSEDLVTLERVLDAIKIDDLHNKYTIVINNITPVVYKQLAKREEAFNTVKKLVNHKYKTDSFCLVEQIEQLKEAVNGVARLPQSVYDQMMNAPTIRIASDQVEPIDVSGLQQRIASLEHELAKMRAALEMLVHGGGGAALTSVNTHAGPGPRKDDTRQEPRSPTSDFRRMDFTSRTTPAAPTRRSNCCGKKRVVLIVVLLVGAVAAGVFTFTHKSDAATTEPSTTSPITQPGCPTTIEGGTCGSANKVYCPGSQCCSQYGFCGVGSPWCDNNPNSIYNGGKCVVARALDAIDNSSWYATDNVTQSAATTTPEPGAST